MPKFSIVLPKFGIALPKFPSMQSTRRFSLNHSDAATLIHVVVALSAYYQVDTSMVGWLVGPHSLSSSDYHCGASWEICAAMELPKPQPCLTFYRAESMSSHRMLFVQLGGASGRVNKNTVFVYHQNWSKIKTLILNSLKFLPHFYKPS